MPLDLNTYKYRLYVSRDNFATFEPGFNGLYLEDIKTYTVENLEPGVEYKAYVTKLNYGFESDPSEILTINTEELIAPVLYVDNPSSEGFDVYLDSFTGIDGYKIYISRDNFATFESGWNGNEQVLATFTVTGLDPGIEYKIKATTYVATFESSFSNIETLSTTGILVTTPTNLSNSSISSNGFTANWDPVAGATSYDVVLGMGSPTNVLTNSCIFSGLNSSTEYLWNVRANNAYSSSSYSGLLTVLTKPATPTGLVVSTYTNTTATIIWNASTGATSYKLYIYDAGVPIAGYNGKVISGTTENVTGLSENTTYTIEVLATNASGDSAFSSEATFKTMIEVIFYASNKNTRSYIYMTNLAKTFDTRLGTQTSYSEGVSISNVAVSSNGIYVAYLTDFYGSGNAQISVKNMQTGVIANYDLNNGLQQRTIAFKNGDNNTLYVADLQLPTTQYISSINLTTGAKTRLINNGTNFGIFGMSFNSDNSVLIHTTGSTGWQTAKRSGVSLDRPSETVLVNHGTFSYGAQSPQFDKVRNKIAYQSITSGFTQIFDMNFDGTSKTQRTTGSLNKASFVYSPDGSKILFAEINGSDRYIQIADTTYNSGTGFFENVSTFINTAGNLVEYPLGWGLVQF